MRAIRGFLAALVTILLCPAPARPQAPAESQPAQAQGSEELARQLANPVASLISVPFQMNWDTGVGPDDQTRWFTNFQPVMPFSVNQDWNLIARLIVPVINQPPLIPNGQATSGVGDILFSAFFSPAKSKAAIWGVGPVLALPTTSDPFLGANKWLAGPTFVVLKQSGPYTYGILFNHLWSYAGDPDRPDVNQSFFQPFLSYTTTSAYTFSISSESSANWQAETGEEWTVPILFNVSKLVKLGRRPMSVGFGTGYFIQSPTGGPEWRIRATITLLFPK